MMQAGFEVGELIKAVELLSNSTISSAQSDGALQDMLIWLGCPPEKANEALRRLGV